MGVLVRFSVLAPDDVLRDFGAGALTRIERASSEAGAYAEVATKAVVAATFSYEVWDSAGSSSSWYRTRYSTATPTLPAHYSDYADPFSTGSPQAFASLDDLLLTVRQTITDTRWLANAEDRLRETAADLVEEIGYSVLRSPVSGATEVRTYTVGIDGIVHAHAGIISITSARIRPTPTADWEVVDTADIQLEHWAKGVRALAAPTGEPYDHVNLTGRGTLLRWPRTAHGIEITGAHQWPVVPRRYRAANIAWARQRLAADNMLPGGPIGPDELGQPIASDRKPQLVYDLIRREAQRFIGCSV